MGWDVIGIVKVVGEEVLLFEVGDEVWYVGDLGCIGSYVEF